MAAPEEEQGSLLADVDVADAQAGAAPPPEESVELQTVKLEEMPLASQGHPQGGRQPQQQQQQDEMSREEHAQVVMNILVPVAITMMLTIAAVRTINLSPTNEVGQVLAYGFSESPSDSTGSRLWHSLLNALVFVVMIIITTFIFVLLYKYRCLKVLFGWLMGSTGVMLALFGGSLMYLALEAQNLPMDYFTFAFILWNFAVVGILSVFYFVPRVLTQVYLVLVSALMAIFFTQLPEWTTWAILAAIATYDIFAVLCPGVYNSIGPLRLLVETAQERQEPIPALLYNASVVIGMAERPDASIPAESGNGHNSNRNNGEFNEEMPPQEEDRSVKLGLGDFVFYSVLIGRAAMFDMLTVFVCFVAIVTGLFATLILLAIFQKALPALPISIFLGITFFFLAKGFVLPYVTVMSSNAVFI